MATTAIINTAAIDRVPYYGCGILLRADTLVHSHLLGNEAMEA